MRNCACYSLCVTHVIALVTHCVWRAFDKNREVQLVRFNLIIINLFSVTSKMSFGRWVFIADFCCNEISVKGVGDVCMRNKGEANKDEQSHSFDRNQSLNSYPFKAMAMSYDKLISIFQLFFILFFSNRFFCLTPINWSIIINYIII